MPSHFDTILGKPIIGINFQKNLNLIFFFGLVMRTFS